MTLLAEWLENFTVFALIFGLVMGMLPNEKYEPYVRLFLGLFFLVLMLYPILQIGAVGETMEEKIQIFLEEQEELEQSAEKEAQKLFEMQIISGGEE